MPAGPDRPAYPVAVSATELPPADDAAVETALHLLCDSALEPIVELVLLARDGGYEAHAHDGSVPFERAVTDGRDHEWIVSETEWASVPWTTVWFLMIAALSLLLPSVVLARQVRALW